MTLLVLGVFITVLVLVGCLLVGVGLDGEPGALLFGLLFVTAAIALAVKAGMLLSV